MEVVKINQDNVQLLKEFISSLGTAAHSFRYFNSRTTDVISNHLVTLILTDNGKPAAYGHLDPENDIVWLGICVIPAYQNKGYGKLMMNELVNAARQLQLKNISLTVDKDNQSAIRMYEQFNFSKEKEFDTYSRYQLVIS